MIGQLTKTSNIKYAGLSYLANLINSASKLNGNKPFWCYIKSHKQEHIRISALETSEGTVTSAVGKAEALNNAFKSVFTIEDLSSLPVLPDSTYPNMQNICITEAGVYNILSQLDPYKAGVQTTFLHMY